MFHRGWFWVHGTHSAAVVDVVQRYGVARVAELEDATLGQLAESGRWAGLVFEVAGCASLGLLERARRCAPLLPVLAVLRAVEPATLNFLQARGIAVVMAPFDERPVTSFVQRAFAASFLPDERVA